MNQKFWIALAIIVLIALGVGGYIWMDRQPVQNAVQEETPSEDISNDEAEVRGVVETFGQKLRNVSLTAEPELAAQSIEREYATFLTPELLAAWKSDPTKALGRLTSSPWPERIEVITMEKMNADQYFVRAEMLEWANGGPAYDDLDLHHPLELMVRRTESGWRIAEVVSETDFQKDWKTFEAPGAYRIKYPSDFRLETGPNSGGGFIGTPLVKISFPENAFQNDQTNFVEAYLFFSSSTKESEVQSCMHKRDPLSIADYVVKEISGIEFDASSTTEAAAGNRYESWIYRALRNGTCYEFALTVRTGVKENYDPPVKEFDKQGAFSVLDQILDTFEFLDTAQ